MASHAQRFAEHVQRARQAAAEIHALGKMLDDETIHWGEHMAIEYDQADAEDRGVALQDVLAVRSDLVSIRKQLFLMMEGLSQQGKAELEEIVADEVKRLI